MDRKIHRLLELLTKYLHAREAMQYGPNNNPELLARFDKLVMAALNGNETPASRVEYAHYLKIATSLVNGILADTAQASMQMKAYLISCSGKRKLTEISAATFERLLAPLELTTTAEQCLQILNYCPRCGGQEYQQPPKGKA